MLDQMNAAALWRRTCRVWGFVLEAATFDRLLNLWMHRWGLMGLEEKTFLAGQISPGMHVVDVGANQGLYTCLFARLVGASGSVTAFEPDPRLFACLAGNVARNGLAHVRCVPAGLSDHAGEARLYRTDFNSGNNRLGAGNPSAPGRSVPVKLVRGDELLRGHCVDFIKIDVQGWEPAVLAGLQETLAANPQARVYFEYWPSGIIEAGFYPAGLLGQFVNLGFELYLFEAGRLQPVRPDDPRLVINGRSWINLLAARPGGSRAA